MSQEGEHPYNTRLAAQSRAAEEVTRATELQRDSRQRNDRGAPDQLQEKVAQLSRLQEEIRELGGSTPASSTPSFQLDSGPGNASLGQLTEALSAMARMMERMNAPSTATTVHVSPDPSTAIPSFNGDSAQIGAEGWLETFSRVADLANWSEQQRLTAIHLKLQGPARDWLISSATRHQSWQEFETAFKSAFVIEESLPDLWRRMAERVQSRDEEVTKYVREKERMCTRVKLSLPDTITEIVRCLWSTEMSFALRDRSYRSVDELLQAIKAYENFTESREKQFPSAQRFGSRSRPSSGHQPFPSSTEVDDAVRSSTVREGVRHADGVHCYNCQKTGHLSRQCSEPRRPLHCTKCNYDGHSAKFCPNQGRSENVTNIVRTTPSKRVYKSVCIDGEWMPALLDTGADESLIKLTPAVQLNRELTAPPGAAIRGVGGQRSSLGELDLRVRVDDVGLPAVHFFIVSDDAFVGPDVIIGTNVIDLPDLLLVRSGGCAHLLNQREAQELAGLVAELERPREVVKCRESVEAAPRTVLSV
nr:uncharacterized protein LOC129382854 [Dermacentor andersoni]